MRNERFWIYFCGKILLDFWALLLPTQTHKRQNIPMENKKESTLPSEIEDVYFTKPNLSYPLPFPTTWKMSVPPNPFMINPSNPQVFP